MTTRDELATHAAIQRIPKELASLSDFLRSQRGEVYVVWFVDPNEHSGVHLEVLDSMPRWEKRPGEHWFVANINGGDSEEL